MTSYVALLRAVNVGGAKLPMADLRAMGEQAGFEAVRTYIASGNLLFRSSQSEPEVKQALEAALAAYFGRPNPVLIRTAEEMAQVLSANPFPDKAPNRTMAVFLDRPPPADALASVSHASDEEEVRLGAREIYIHYGEGMGRSKLRVPAARDGTARNINTVAALAKMTREP